MERFTWKCVKPLFLKYFFLIYTILHCQSSDRIRIRWKFSVSDQKAILLIFKIYPWLIDCCAARLGILGCIVSSSNSLSFPILQALPPVIPLCQVTIISRYRNRMVSIIAYRTYRVTVWYRFSLLGQSGCVKFTKIGIPLGSRVFKIPTGLSFLRLPDSPGLPACVHARLPACICARLPPALSSWLRLTSLSTELKPRSTVTVTTISLNILVLLKLYVSLIKNLLVPVFSLFLETIFTISKGTVARGSCSRFY